MKFNLCFSFWSDFYFSFIYIFFIHIFMLFFCMNIINLVIFRNDFWMNGKIFFIIIMNILNISVVCKQNKTKAKNYKWCLIFSLYSLKWSSYVHIFELNWYKSKGNKRRKCCAKFVWFSQIFTKPKINSRKLRDKHTKKWLQSS